MLQEVAVTCPACWETITLAVDPSGGSACYTEDCPVCCHPMSVDLRVEDDGTCTVTVEAESD